MIDPLLHYPHKRFPTHFYPSHQRLQLELLQSRAINSDGTSAPSALPGLTDNDELNLLRSRNKKLETDFKELQVTPQGCMGTDRCGFLANGSEAEQNV